MRIAIMGAGNVGGGLGTALAAVGHEVVFGVRDPDSDKTRVALDAARGSFAADPAVAVDGTDVVVFALRWDAVPDTVAALPSLAGRIVIDAMNRVAGPAQPATRDRRTDHRDPGKSLRAPGHPARPEQRRRRERVLMETAFAVAPEIGLAPACRVLGVSRATAYRHRAPKPPATPRSRHRSPLALSDEERAAILRQLHAARPTASGFRRCVGR